MNDNIFQQAVYMLQIFVHDRQVDGYVTPELINNELDKLLLIKPAWANQIDRKEVVDELIRRFSVWVGDEKTIADNGLHQHWLTNERKRGWEFWHRYRQWLEGSLPISAVDALDRSTDNVVGLLEDPKRMGSWSRRGLVVGHVQSGKTSHYTGLICKAADAGYTIIIVLAGIHNNLRSQTQMRLDEGFLGFETQPDVQTTGQHRLIGVGRINGTLKANYVTNRSEKGDFRTAVARNLGITPGDKPWLFVVKKNQTVLRQLFRWISDHVADMTDNQTGRRLVSQHALLLIDDEADHASVDTGELLRDLDGRPDENHQPKAINSGIRKILHAFNRSAYVGYTATPFANIFIHDKAETKDEGPDLFPSSFIVNLPAPSNYVGPMQVFGAPNSQAMPLPMLRPIFDQSDVGGSSGWMPLRHRSDHLPNIGGRDALPASLVEAIDSFLIATAIRKLRGQGKEHASMLVHVTRFVATQSRVKEQISRHLNEIRQKLSRGIDDQPIILRMQRLWQDDFAATAGQFNQAGIELGYMPPWSEIEQTLRQIVADVDVKSINGTAKDALDYVEHRGTGLKVIAIGGDKLARGLTLEGLTTSYFMRASKLYDTLMQMGRWFGYRPGYMDLCRLYTTDELADWFRHITDAAEELREEFDLMAASGATPREYGLKVQSHSVLMVTSKLKMRSAKTLHLSFSGQVVETVALFREGNILKANLQATETLLKTLRADLGEPEINPERTRPDHAKHRWNALLWQGVSSQHILDFLERYQTHPEAHKVNSKLLANFIESMNKQGELTQWTVAVVGGGEAAYEILPKLSVNLTKRAHIGASLTKYSIRRLLSPRDEAIDLDVEAWKAAMAFTKELWQRDPGRRSVSEAPEEPKLPSGPAIRHIRGVGYGNIRPQPEKGLLLLYLLDPKGGEVGFPEGAVPIVAMGISLPKSSLATTVPYVVNNVLMEQEYGPSE